MGLSTAVGSLAQPGSTGNQSATGLGFQPVIVFFWGTHKTADGSAVDFAMAHGVATSSTSRRCGFMSGAGSGGSNTSWMFDATHCITFLTTGTTTVVAQADFVSMDSGGFTINWGTVDANARVVNYLAIGGTDLTNVSLLTKQCATVTGNAAYTGAGFQPDAVIIWAPFRQDLNAPPQSGSGTTTTEPSYGFGVSSTSRAHSSFEARIATRAKSYQRTASILSRVATGAVNIEADLVSLDSDGFTLNFTTAGAARYFFAVCMKGAQFATTSFNQPGSTGNQAVTGLAFQPSAVIFSSFSLAAASTVQANMRFNQGAAVSSSARFSVGAMSVDSTTSNCSQDLDRTKCIKMMTEGNGSPTTQAAADFVSMDSTGFTVNWSSADATARQILALAIGAAAVAGGDELLETRRLYVIPAMGGY